MDSSKSRDDFYKELGKRLRAVRTERKLTQAMLAKDLGISYQQYHKYEMGMNKIPADRLHKTCLILDVSIALVLWQL